VFASLFAHPAIQRVAGFASCEYNNRVLIVHVLIR
jgi:hypothetical protein